MASWMSGWSAATPLSTTATTVPAPRVVSQADSAFTSTPATPALPSTVWPVLRSPHSSSKLGSSVAAAPPFTMRFGSAHATESSCSSSRLAARAVPGATRSTCVSGSSMRRAEEASTLLRAAARIDADAPCS